VSGGPEDALDGPRSRLAREAGVDPGEVRAIASPYRVCPLGAHVDHQGGPVLGMAIGLHTVLAFAPGRGPEVRLASDNFPGETAFDLRHPAAGGGDWGRYARGAAWALRERLPAEPRGLVGRVGGLFPGSGLSSSASVLLAYLSALASVNELELSPAELVALSRRAENEFVGLASGILDPASIVGARRGELLSIDTRAARWVSVPCGAAAGAPRVLVAYSGVPRNLPGTGFNERVAECRAAAAALARCAGLPPCDALGDLDDAVFAEHLEALPTPLARRARHFAGERDRVRRGADCWRRGDLEAFGALMNRSCESSVRNYEVGSAELVALQEILERTPGVLGARFSGGGYGGCAIAFVEPARAEEARERAARAFAASFPALRGAACFLLTDGADGLGPC